MKFSESIALFNSPVEVGLRALFVLSATFPSKLSMQKLVIMDYLVVHSDDLPEGPPGLHPKTPHRGGEILVRRSAIRHGLALYQSRGLIAEFFSETGVVYSGTDRSGSFIDTLNSEYLKRLQTRVTWAVANYAAFSDDALQALVNASIGSWGTEFVLESVISEGDLSEL